MNVTQQRKIEKVMRGRVDKFRRDFLDRTLDEITSREPELNALTEKEYEGYLKAYQSLQRAWNRHDAKAKQLGYERGDRNWNGDSGQMPVCLTVEKFNEHRNHNKELNHVKRFIGQKWDYSRDRRLDMIREQVGRSLAMNETKTRSLYPSLVEWYEQDTEIRDWADEGLVVQIYVADGDAEDLLNSLTEKLESLVS